MQTRRHLPRVDRGQLSCCGRLCMRMRCRMGRYQLQLGHRRMSRRAVRSWWDMQRLHDRWNSRSHALRLRLCSGLGRDQLCIGYRCKCLVLHFCCHYQHLCTSFPDSPLTRSSALIVYMHRSARQVLVQTVVSARSPQSQHTWLLGSTCASARSGGQAPRARSTSTSVRHRRAEMARRASSRRLTRRCPSTSFRVIVRLVGCPDTVQVARTLR